jgi:hypothetical protein
LGKLLVFGGILCFMEEFGNLLFLSLIWEYLFEPGNLFVLSSI